VTETVKAQPNVWQAKIALYLKPLSARCIVGQSTSTTVISIRHCPAVHSLHFLDMLPEIAGR